MKVGISMLTNGARLDYLRDTLDSFFKNCYYRPLVIGIFDNGSTDGTWEYLQSLSPMYGVEWRVERSDVDLGLSIGVNHSLALVREFEYAIHLESDWHHLPESESGVDKMWLHRALKWMKQGKCDYLYLRRMVNDREMMMHWWSQWFDKVVEEEDDYLSVPTFWWSNNPALRRNEALYRAGILPMKEIENETKASPNWTKSELGAGSPPQPWIHRWGIFIHEKPTHGDYQSKTGCGQYGPYGISTCKYGFFKDGNDKFCQRCIKTTGYEDMPEHDRRARTA